MDARDGSKGLDQIVGEVVGKLLKSAQACFHGILRDDPDRGDAALVAPPRQLIEAAALGQVQEYAIEGFSVEHGRCAGRTPSPLDERLFSTNLMQKTNRRGRTAAASKTHPLGLHASFEPVPGLVVTAPYSEVAEEASQQCLEGLCRSLDQAALRCS
jgi:hypothetical protein